MLKTRNLSGTQVNMSKHANSAKRRCSSTSDYPDQGAGFADLISFDDQPAFAVNGQFEARHMPTSKERRRQNLPFDIVKQLAQG